MKIIAFAASNSSVSINKQLAHYTATLVNDASIEVLDLNDFEMPIFSEDREKEIGHHPLAIEFYVKLGSADAIIIGFAEHNGSYSAAYKNIFDWTSRYNREIFQNKPMILLATSPGPSGAVNVLKQATDSAPFFAADVKASLSIPSFYDNFKEGKMTNLDLNNQLIEAVSNL
ncbi:NADPH-dependent FMN reductase [Psychrobium sp. nBUS_13]|uniref:NADPH-dependent FMN reductase n=1 Tax=Psychrobium sp. nBUS_13 TaxID=3395319 RepID=UPI003EB743FE